MKAASLDRDVARFCTDNQCVSLQPRGRSFTPAGLDPKPDAPVARRMPRRVQAALALVAVTVFFSLLALFVMALQPGRPEQRENATDSGKPESNPHSSRVAEMQGTTQKFRGYVENSSSWHKEIQRLKYRMDNVSSQVQLLGGYLEAASAEIQQAKGMLKGTGALALETQALRISLELASADIRSLRADLEKAKALTSHTQGLLKSSTENTSAELHMLGRGLEGAQTEIQALRGRLQSSNDLSSRTQSFLQSSVDNTSAEIQTLRGHLESVGDEMNSLKKDLETVTAQTQKANSHLDQTEAQIQVLNAELKSANSVNSLTEAIKGQLRDTSIELQTLRGDVKDVAGLPSKIQTLQCDLRQAKAELQSLKNDLETAKTLTAKIQKEQSRLGALQETVASQERMQRTQNQLLQLILQGWKAFQGSLYYFSLEKKSWHEAEQFCVSQGAHLASVTSQVEQAFLVQFTSTVYHWIGLTDQGTEGNWHWVDGTPFNHTQSNGFWGKNQPDNWRHENGQNEDCVHVQSLWNDIVCGASFHWVCKKPIGQAVA